MKSSFDDAKNTGEAGGKEKLPPVKVRTNDPLSLIPAKGVNKTFIVTSRSETNWVEREIPGSFCAKFEQTYPKGTPDMALLTETKIP